MGSHLIDRVKFDIRAENTFEAKEIQDKIFSICRYQLDTALDASMAQEADQLSLSHDRLELDLGYIPKHALEGQLIPKLLEAFSSALGELVQDRGPAEYPINDFEAIKLFLEKGARHWSKREDYDPANDLVAVIRDQWPSFLRFLKKSRLQMQVSTRMVSIASAQTYRSMITKLRPTDSDFILGFVKSSVNVLENSALTARPKTQWESSLKVLILHDLIKNHDSLFNRKMFIRRQLMAIAATHRINYLELLEAFSELLSTPEIAYRYHDSLPTLVKDLVEEAHLPSIEAETERPSMIWDILFYREEWSPEYNKKIKEHWSEWVSQYAGEMKKSFETEVRTVEQVDFIVNTLSDEEIDDVITILIPHLSKYVISYKRSVIKGNKQSNKLTTAEGNLRSTLNFLIVSYLTLDMGTSFNKKEFFTQQIVRLSRHYNLKYNEMIVFLIQTLEASKEPILFGMLELIRQIREGLIIAPATDEGPEFKTYDGLELLTYYLETGRLQTEMTVAGNERPFEQLMKVLTDEKYTHEIFDFVIRKKKPITSHVAVYDMAIYLELIRLILSRKINLSALEVKTIISQIKKHSRQSVNQGAYRSYVFEFINGMGKKIKAGAVRKYDLDSLSDPFSLLCRFLIIKLSLEEFYSEKISDDPKQGDTKYLTFEQARARLFSSLDHLITAERSHPYHQAQVHISLRKLFESKQESQSLLYSLSVPRLLLLFRHSNKLLRYRILHGLASRSMLLNILLKELKVRSVLDDQFAGWAKIIQLDAKPQERGLKKQLLRSLEEIGINQEERESISARLDELKEAKRKETSKEMEELIGFFESAVLPAGWTMTGIEAVFLKHYSSNYKALHRALATVTYRRQTIEGLIDVLGKNVLIRWLKLLMGNDFDPFIKEIGHLEDLLIQLNPDHENEFYNKKHWERVKFMLAYEYQFRSISFPMMVRYYLRYFTKYKAMEYKEFSRQITQRLKEVAPEVKPEVIKRKAKEMQQVLAEDLPVVEELLSESQEESLLDQSYKIENAGLIIAWPFYKNLFSQLEYLAEDGQFKSTYEQSKAVRLLQYIATGESDQPEYNMTLNKLLCGYPLVEPLESTLEISDSEKKLADSMLEGLIANWNKLGNTTIEGLRNTFLMRKGALNHEDSNWTLRVEKLGMDVLLDFLPWTITSIKTPWVEGMLFVEWR